MKHGLLVFFLLLIALSHSRAQEAIYFANGDKLPNARLIDATDEKVVLSVVRDGTTGQYKFQRSNVLMAFNAVGNFLVISTLPIDGAAARQQIEQFSTAATPIYKSDFLVKAVPLMVIPATISYESDQVVNYKTAQGTAASINKDELVMILRREGRHQLIMPPTDIVSLLPTIRKQIESGKTPLLAAVASRPEPVAAQVPAQALPDSVRQVAPVVPTTTTTPTVVVVNTGQSAEPTAPSLVPAVNPSVPIGSGQSAKPALNEADYLTYREKAMRHVDQFSNYLNIITNKALSSDRREQAINQAVDLFMPTATIEVTSKTRSGSRRYPIREYLTRLQLLPYSRAKIEWSEIQYIRELTQAADGNYYGTITGQQSFVGYAADGHTPLYTDLTQKNVRVRLRSYDKAGDVKWDVLLGNIGVANN